MSSSWERYKQARAWHYQVCRALSFVYRSPMRWRHEGDPYCKKCDARLGWFDEVPHVRLCEHYTRWQKRFDRIVEVLAPIGY